VTPQRHPVEKLASASGKVESIVGARRLLTINTGSSSLKAALYRLREDTTEPPEIRAEALRRAGKSSGSRPGGSRPDLDLRVRGGDRKSHRLLEGALRGSARGTRLDLDPMNPPTEISTMGSEARFPHGTLTRLALPVGAYRVVNVIRPPSVERVVRARKPLQLVIPLRDGGLRVKQLGKGV
jgi:hypothetical protein